MAKNVVPLHLKKLQMYKVHSKGWLKKNLIGFDIDVLFPSRNAPPW